MVPIIIFLSFIAPFQMCRCQDFDVVLPDTASAELRDSYLLFDIPEYRSTIQNDDIKKSSVENQVLNRRITASETVSDLDKNPRKETTTLNEKNNENLEKLDNRMDVFTSQPTIDLSIEAMFNYMRRDKTISNSVDGIESYLNNNSKLSLRSYNNLTKNYDASFNLEALLNYTLNDDDLSSENLPKRKNMGNLTVTNTGEKEDIRFSDINPVSDVDILNSDIRRNVENKNIVKPHLVKNEERILRRDLKNGGFNTIKTIEKDDIRFTGLDAKSGTLNRNSRKTVQNKKRLKSHSVKVREENGKIEYSMVSDASDLEGEKPSDVLLSPPVFRKTLERDGKAILNYFGGTKRNKDFSFGRVPVDYLLALLRSNITQDSESNTRTGSSELSGSVVSFIKDSVRNIGDIVFGHG